MMQASTLLSRAARLAAVSLIAVSLVAAGCGDDDDDNGDGDDPTATVSASEPTTAATEPAGEPTEVETPAAGEAPPAGTTTLLIGDGGDLGAILTDADGLTLYTFANDTADSGTSACGAGCVDAWPPATVTGEPSAPAEATGELGTITRDDGSAQVTYNGLPLYRFSGDAAPGDTNGHNVGTIWFAATP